MKRRVTCGVAILLAGFCYCAARLPSLSEPERLVLAGRFAFRKMPLPEAAEKPAYKSVRDVHPSLSRISAWVSSVGAAATLTDLDGDQISNDLVYVDSRTGFVTLTSVPGTRDRFKIFTIPKDFWAHNKYDVGCLSPMGTVAGDFNEDGLTDLLVYFWGRTPVIYFRKPGALAASAFEPRELIESGERWYSDCATQADLDGDGHIDLLIGNYFQDGARILDPNATGIETMHQGKAKALNGGFKHLLLSHGGGKFTEVKDAFREEVARGWTVAMGAADLDGDLLPEIYFAHDFGPDRLLHNRSTPGKLSFAELEGKRGWFTPKSCVLGQDSFKGMGCDFADINGDGFLDIYVSNIATKFGLMESHFLWQSTGDTESMRQGVAPYVQNSEKLGLSRSGFGWDSRLADFDNDGTLEAVQACGFIKGKINRWPELQALGTSNDKIVHNPKFWPSFKPGADLSGGDWNPFFVRAGDGRYYDIAKQIGLGDPMVSRGIAIADVDRDGRLDFVAANQWGPSFFFHNDAPQAGAFLGLRLTQGKGTPAIGAAATVALPDGRKFVGQVDGGSGHSGRRSPEIHFGLGQVEKGKAVMVEIKWRAMDGKVRQQAMELLPGWHNINLGNAEKLTAFSAR